MLKGLEDIRGWLSRREAEFLYTIVYSRARHRKQLNVVEIGSFCGKSTISLAAALKDAGSSSKCYAIDWHQGSPEHREDLSFKSTKAEFLENINAFDLEGHVVPIFKLSSAALEDVPGEIDVLWIDGAHDYASVKSDYTLYCQGRLATGGIVLFHDANDTDWEGPFNVIQEFILANDEYELKYICGQILGFRKVSSSDGRKTLRNRLAVEILRKTWRTRIDGRTLWGKRILNQVLQRAYHFSY